MELELLSDGTLNVTDLNRVAAALERIATIAEEYWKWISMRQ